MAIYKELNVGGGNQNPFGWIGSIIMLVVGLLLAYLVVKGIFTLLFWLSPVLLIAGVAIDPKGALALGKSLITLSMKNPLIPIALVILSALWFPFFLGIVGALSGGFLLTKALVKKKIKKVFGEHIPQKEKEVFAEYEEVTEDETFLDLPEVKKEERPKQQSGNEYDNLFE